MTTPPSSRKKKKAKHPPPPAVKPAKLPIPELPMPGKLADIGKGLAPAAVGATPGTGMHPAGTLGWVRSAAEVAYITDLSSPSVAVLVTRPEFAAVTKATMEKWAADDGWHRKREEFRRQWQEQALRKIGSGLVQQRVKEAEVFDRLFAKAAKKLEDDVVMAGSWEGVLGGMIKLAQTIEEWRTKIAAHVAIPESFGNSPGAPTIPPVAKPRLSDEEAREAALMIIRKRREKMRLEARGGTTASESGTPDGDKDEEP